MEQAVGRAKKGAANDTQVVTARLGPCEGLAAPGRSKLRPQRPRAGRRGRTCGRNQPPRRLRVFCFSFRLKPHAGAPFQGNGCPASPCQVGRTLLRPPQAKWNEGNSTGTRRGGKEPSAHQIQRQGGLAASPGKLAPVASVRLLGSGPRSVVPLLVAFVAGVGVGRHHGVVVQQGEVPL